MNKGKEMARKPPLDAGLLKFIAAVPGGKTCDLTAIALTKRGKLR